MKPSDWTTYDSDKKILTTDETKKHEKAEKSFSPMQSKRRRTKNRLKEIVFG